MIVEIKYRVKSDNFFELDDVTYIGECENPKFLDDFSFRSTGVLYAGCVDDLEEMVYVNTGRYLYVDQPDNWVIGELGTQIDQFIRKRKLESLLNY